MGLFLGLLIKFALIVTLRSGMKLTTKPNGRGNFVYLHHGQMIYHHLSHHGVPENLEKPLYKCNMNDFKSILEGIEFTDDLKSSEIVTLKKWHKGERDA